MVQDRSLVPLPTPNSDGEGADGKLTVLLVDDNEAITRALVHLLGRQGFRTVAFNTGTEALAYLESNRPAAAVIDIHLPDISGLVLSQKLRDRLGERPPIIVLSGDTSMENIRSLPHVGATYFISKPFRSEHLIERLREMLPA